MTDHHETPALSAGRNIHNIFQAAAHWLVIVLAVSASIATLLAMVGVLPWLSLNLVSGAGETLPVGTLVQSVGTVFLIGLCAFLPGVRQIQHLERSHRDFKLSMDDVAKAYQLSHAADRQRTFALSSEFEDMRERMIDMRRHPDLSHLEPEVLELAAQMSHTTRELAQVYSDDKVSRAKEFLRHRQQELDTLNENINLALLVTQELRRWQNDVEASEHEANRQMDRLEKDLEEILPQIGLKMDAALANAADDGKVISLSSSPSSKGKQLTTETPELHGTGIERPI